MKNIIAILVMLLSFISFSQEIQETQEQLLQRLKDEAELKLSKQTFTFDIIVLNKMEKTIDSDLLDNFNKISLLENNTYGNDVLISSFKSTDKFVFTNKFEKTFNSGKGTQVIKNINTGKYYIIFNQAVYLQDYSSSSTSGHKYLIKYDPYVPTATEQELIKRYKSLISGANANITVLRAIQQRNLTKWAEFDPNKMSTVDTQTWNKNYLALKAKHDKLDQINIEDKNDRAQDALTTAELVSLDNILSWVNNFQTF